MKTSYRDRCTMSGILMLALLHVAPAAKAQTYSESALYSFCASSGCAYQDVLANLIQLSDGSFYGMADYGAGGADESVVFKLAPTGEYTVLHTFCALGAPGCTDAGGAGSLIEGGDGNIYGTNEFGGANGYGSVFRIAPNGAYRLMYSFCSLADCADGTYTGGAMIEGSDGNYYGTTSSTIFKITSAGKLTTLVGGLGGPQALLQGSDGAFYGTTYNDGSSQGCSGGCGSVFKLTPTNMFSTLYSFCSEADCADGQYANATLVEVGSGDFYGTTYNGGQSNDGTIFKITPGGVLTSIYQFCSQSNCADGGWPNEGITLGSDGNVYGTTQIYGYGVLTGDVGVGTVFRYNPVSGLTTPYTFCDTLNCDGGSQPMAGLVQGNDGDFYGTTTQGGTESDGVIFRLTVNPTLAAPVQLSLSSSQVQPGNAVTASLKVLNAFSLTMQQCYAFQNGTPLGKIPGTYNSSTQIYTFSTSITPTTAGIYNYAVTCGGVESGFASLTVGDTTTTTLTASPNPVTPPASVTLTATITRTTGTGVPGGSVTFSSGTIVLGKASLNGSGVASLSASSKGVAAGTYPVVATYSGDTEDVGSASAAVSVMVE